MRRLIALVLALLACGRDAPGPETRGAAASREPDPIVIRVPRAGGIARAAVYPALDSIIWEASGFPALDRVLAFDADAGMLSVVTRASRPAHLDLRLGRSALASRDTLRSLTSANGSDIFGVDRRGRVVRLSPSGSWSFTPPSPAHAVYAQQDGPVLVAAFRGGGTTLWRLHPPDEEILDSTALPRTGGLRATLGGDRLYLATDTALLVVATRTLETVRSVRTRERPVAAAFTPSGDRLYVALAGRGGLRLINRFSNGGPGEIELPGEAAELRMDPLGRYLLARPSRRDSVWVIGVATGRLEATLPTRWTSDLPAVAPNGAVATISGRDVVFLDARSGSETLRARGGASEFWIFFHWNGFRPRAAGIDAPVSFPTNDTATIDTLDGASPDSADRPTAPATPPGSLATPRFTVSFATLMSQPRALALADSIVVGAARARVAAGQAAGVPIYRVVIGPYGSRADAEAAGRASGRQFWIFEGQP